MTLAAQLGRILTDARGATPRREFAATLGLAPNTLLELEAGTSKSNPTLERVERMAEAYGVELELRVVARRRRRPPTIDVDEHASRPAAPTAGIDR